MCYGLMLHVTFIKFMTSNNHLDIYDDTKYAKALRLIFNEFKVLYSMTRFDIS